MLKLISEFSGEQLRELLPCLRLWAKVGSCPVGLGVQGLETKKNILDTYNKVVNELTARELNKAEGCCGVICKPCQS